jgi:hypothetical protein
MNLSEDRESKSYHKVQFIAFWKECEAHVKPNDITLNSSGMRESER